eukprot:CAMPEP_0197719684 /NCGR_PEP_ID=MMETSP1434-20131217/3335_1 /TAXON_ID=265543 /ORGANISM="Minutocellus polymorphus, Strain CCMP3303" /LENGTH=255 /DNA_ID=CAMNT_0043304451 /DNA_START=81 /DNA_END=848 /DNA_ORIENTATION=+
MLQLRLSTLLLLTGFCLLGSAGAFSFDTTKRYAFQKDRVSTESYLAELESEYSQLQDSLLLELSTTNIHGHDHAEEIVEDMLEKAADVAAFQRYRMEEVVEEAEAEMKHARSDRRAAHFVKEQAHREAEMAAHDADMVKDFDGAYEDLERTRDLSVVRADHLLERDAKQLDWDSETLELESGDRKKYALSMLKELQEKESELRASLKELRQRKNQHSLEEWRHSSEANEHLSFLQRIREKLKHYSIRKHSQDAMP